MANDPMSERSRMCGACGVSGELIGISDGSSVYAWVCQACSVKRILCTMRGKYRADNPPFPQAYAALPVEAPITAREQAAWRAGARAGLKMAAGVLKKRAADYHAEHGSTETDTGVTNYPGNGFDLMCEWEERAEEIEALPLPAQPAATEGEPSL
jgi:hypothetical protein